MTTDFYVKVSNIPPQTTNDKLHDFFSFCGKVENIDFKQGDSVATVYFEKPSAVTTALMLDGGTFEGVILSVKAEKQHPDEDRKELNDDGVPISQSDKPRSGIAAELLARGYTLSDQVLHRAIELDKQKGISTRFLSYFQSLDTTIGAKALGPDQTVSAKVQATLASATERARVVDEQKGISKSMHDYYTKAISSPFGQKVKEFYLNTNKQLYDIHEEARRISESHKSTSSPTSATAPQQGNTQQPMPAPAATPTGADTSKPATSAT